MLSFQAPSALLAAMKGQGKPVVPTDLPLEGGELAQAFSFVLNPPKASLAGAATQQIQAGGQAENGAALAAPDLSFAALEMPEIGPTVPNSLPAPLPFPAAVPIPVALPSNLQPLSLSPLSAQKVGSDPDLLLPGLDAIHQKNTHPDAAGGRAVQTVAPAPFVATSPEITQAFLPRNFATLAGLQKTLPAQAQVANIDPILHPPPPSEGVASMLPKEPPAATVSPANAEVLAQPTTEVKTLEDGETDSRNAVLQTRTDGAPPPPAGVATPEVSTPPATPAANKPVNQAASAPDLQSDAPGDDAPGDTDHGAQDVTRPDPDQAVLVIPTALTAPTTSASGTAQPAPLPQALLTGKAPPPAEPASQRPASLPDQQLLTPMPVGKPEQNSAPENDGRAPGDAPPPRLHSTVATPAGTPPLGPTLQIFQPSVPTKEQRQPPTQSTLTSLAQKTNTPAQHAGANRADGHADEASADVQRLTPLTAGPQLPGTAEAPFAAPLETLKVDLNAQTGAPLRHDAQLARPETAAAIARQLIEVASQAIDKPVELALNPEELGRVTMRVTSGEGGVGVAISAERPETLDLMKRHIDQLARDFREMGFSDATFSFAQQNKGQNPAAQGAHGTAMEAADQPVVASSENVLNLNLQSSTGLDLRL